MASFLAFYVVHARIGGRYDGKDISLPTVYHCKSREKTHGLTQTLNFHRLHYAHCQT
jgi:hypothetical protein